MNPAEISKRITRNDMPLIFTIYIYMYLVVLGLSCGMQDLLVEACEI